MVKMFPIPNMHREFRINIIKNLTLLFNGVVEESEVGTTKVERNSSGYVTKVIEPSSTTTITRNSDGSVEYYEVEYSEQTVRVRPVLNSEGQIERIEREVL